MKTTTKTDDNRRHVAAAFLKRTAHAGAAVALPV
jgi:hypothetical protein